MRRKDPKLYLYLYISMSLDGFIATSNHDLSWLDIVAQEGEDYGYAAFTQNIQAYIVGRKTYEVVLGLTGGVFPQAQQYDCYVLTRQDLKGEDGVQLYDGDLAALVGRLKQEGKNIYCDGGGGVVQALMQLNLIEEYIISIIPMILGDGIRLFRGGLAERKRLELLNTKTFETGLVQLHYATHAPQL